jgi:hypothetical protein
MQTEASKLAHQVSKLGMVSLYEFVDVLKELEDAATISGQGNANFSGVAERIHFHEWLEQKGVEV